ncbi:hypothetical protein K461DRAFT_280803 [Myriangium duriaei CBS 260.36]|uniref:Uncharacterized protein n=1 Tax=Myriangium duriaei CBS 260.36 TaxID=1168546 RepID=A0A9P4IVM5_9PEZI|nr:hypothetical protein K461DRAFT_280803 [Myriangium duriaei CBS 260.36]
MDCRSNKTVDEAKNNKRTKIMLRVAITDLGDQAVRVLARGDRQARSERHAACSYDKSGSGASRFVAETPDGRPIPPKAVARKVVCVLLSASATAPGVVLLIVYSR